MNSLLDIKSYNSYIGLAKPKNEDIDIGYFISSELKLKSEPIALDFYKISLKINYIDYSKNDSESYNAVFFNCPNTVIYWDVTPSFSGMYLHLSKKYINKNLLLLKNFLEYGQHEALFLSKEETIEIHSIFEKIYQYSLNITENHSIIKSYIIVLITIIKSYYTRQISKDINRFSPIVSDFQRLLYNYYNTPVEKLPSVQYFANKLKLSPNYLGNIIKQFTKKSAIENIHEFVIGKAKNLLENRNDLNHSEIAYELGFKYPNYFAKFFKKQVHYSPREYRVLMTSKK